jgi:energy-coupling factor transporter ATP-binding protein EcfA2
VSCWHPAQVVGSIAKRGISGGQRKRANIAVELVLRPSLLFLDEPTSGLDAAVAHDVVTALSSYSQRGMNVICVIHQPRHSIFELFDSVMLLAAGGRVVCAGPQFLTVPYLGFLGFGVPKGESIADFLLDVVAGGGRGGGGQERRVTAAGMFNQCYVSG